MMAETGGVVQKLQDLETRVGKLEELFAKKIDVEKSRNSTRTKGHTFTPQTTGRCTASDVSGAGRSKLSAFSSQGPHTQRANQSIPSEQAENDEGNALPENSTDTTSAVGSFSRLEERVKKLELLAVEWEMTDPCFSNIDGINAGQSSPERGGSDAITLPREDVTEEQDKLVAESQVNRKTKHMDVGQRSNSPQRRDGIDKQIQPESTQSSDAASHQSKTVAQGRRDYNRHPLSSADFRVDRSPADSSSCPLDTIVDSLRHRTKVFATSKKRWNRKSDDWGQNRPVTNASSNKHSFTELLKMLPLCYISGKMELCRYLLDQRYTVPLIVDKDGAICSYLKEALRFTSVKLSSRSVPIMTDDTLPRVAFLSHRPEQLTENAHMISEVLNCTISSATCKDKTGTVAELGIGFLKDVSTSQSNYFACLTLYVRGDHKPLLHFIKQFADIIVLELDPKHDIRFDKDILDAYTDKSQILLQWQSSHNELDTDNDEKIMAISGSFHEVAKEMTYALIDPILNTVKSRRSPIAKLMDKCFRLETENASYVTHMTSVNNKISSIKFEQLRKNLSLQQSFSKENKLRLKLKQHRNNQDEQGQLKNLQTKIEDEIAHRQNYRHEKNSKSIISLFLEALRIQDSDTRVLGLQQLEMSVAEQCSKMLKKEAQVVSDAWIEYQSNIQSKEALKNYYSAKKHYSDQGVGLEHLWRELSHIYTGNVHIHGDYAQFPSLAARHLVDGFSLEIMDGDAGAVNVAWIKAVMANLDNKLMQVLGHRPKVLVISAMGPQSSGKSTLLNTMFGSRLRTSAGQCTRGVHLQLIKAEREKFDYTLVIDTEGIRSPEYFGTDKAIWADNRMATFAVLPADICLVTTVNEEDSAIKEVLPIVMLALKGANIAEAIAGRTRSLVLFVYSRVDTSQQSRHKFQQNERQLLVYLEDAAKKVKGLATARTEGNTQARDHTHDALHNFLPHFKISDNEANSDIKYLGLLNKGENPPNDSPNYEYGVKVVQMREYIQKRLEENTFEGHNLADWADYLEIILRCIDTTDFEMNFKTTMQYQTYRDLESKINKCREKVAEQYSSKFEEIEAKIIETKNKPDLDHLLKKLKNGVKVELTQQSDIVKNLIKKQAFSQIENSEISQWEDYLDNQHSTWAELLKRVFRSRWEIDILERQYVDLIFRDLRSDPKTVLDMDANNRKRFEDTFNKYKIIAEGENPLINVHDSIRTLYRERKLQRVLEREKSDIDQYLSQTVRALVDNIFQTTNRLIVSQVEDFLKEQIIAPLRNVKYYDAKVVRRAIDLTEKFADVGPKTDKFNVSLHFAVYIILISNLTRIQRDWERNYSVFLRLEQSKKRLMKQYLSECKSVPEMADVVARNACGGFVQAVKNGYEHYLATRVKNSLVSQLRITNPDKMRAYLNLDLLSAVKDRNDEKLFWILENHHHHYEYYLKKLIIKKVNTVQTWTELIWHLKSAIVDASKAAIKMGNKRGKEEFKTALVKGLPREIKRTLSDNIWHDMPSFEGKIWVDIAHQIYNEVKDLKFEDLFPLFSSETIIPLVEALLEEGGSMTARGRCRSYCPQCHMGCIKHFGHEKEQSEIIQKHDCPHQPPGLAGLSVGFGKHAEEMNGISCAQAVRDNLYFALNNVQHSFQDFCEIYPSWEMPDIRQRQELREYIFYNYQTELVKRHPNVRKCSQITQAYDHDLQSLDLLLREAVSKDKNDAQSVHTTGTLV